MIYSHFKKYRSILLRYSAASARLVKLYCYSRVEVLLKSFSLLAGIPLLYSFTCFVLFEIITYCDKMMKLKKEPHGYYIKCIANGNLIKNFVRKVTDRNINNSLFKFYNLQTVKYFICLEN